MRYEIKSYNDFCFTLEIVRFGSGISGLSPSIQIKKFSSNEFWDGTTWNITPSSFSMSEPDSLNMPGLYSFDFNSTTPNPIDTFVDTKFLVKITEPIELITEYILVTRDRLAEIEDGPVALISNGILQANIWKPIVDPYTLSVSAAGRDTIARAISSNYLGTVYKTADTTDSEDIYTCTYTDSSGKFYSGSLPSLSMLEKLIKQDAILLKGWSGSDTPNFADFYTVKMKITEAGIDTNGKYLVLEASDGSMDSYTSGSDSILITNRNTADPGEIASAVWEEPLSDHSTPDTFGMITRIIAGLVHFNHRIKDAEYDQTGRMTGCRVVVYPSAIDAQADTNSLSTIIINSVYNSANNMTSYLATQE